MSWYAGQSQEKDDADQYEQRPVIGRPRWRSQSHEEQHGRYPTMYDTCICARVIANKLEYR